MKDKGLHLGARDTAGSAEVARAAGRGVLYITAAKLFFIVSGYAIHFALPRLLEERGADPEAAKALYGFYGLVSSVLNVLSTVVVQSTIQSVSKLVSETEGRGADVRSAALRVQAFLAGGIALAYFLFANLIAEWHSTPALADYYRVSTVVVLCYSFYAIFIGVLNGQREFKKQALFDMAFATMKASFIIGAAGLGLSLMGVFSGFALAAAVVLVVAAFVVGVRGGAARPGLQKRLLQMMVPIMLYTLVTNLLLTVDLWVLGAVMPGASVADYTAAQVIARIPYQAMLSVTFVVFPLVSRSTFEGDRETTQGYIRVTLRYSLVALAAIVAVIASAASDVVAVPYPESYRSAGPSLSILALAMLFFALFSIMGAILNGCGRAPLAMMLGAVTLGLDAGLCYAFAPHYGPLGTAAGTAIAVCLGAALGLFALWRLFRAGIPAVSLLRVCAASAAVWGVAQVLPPTGRILTIAKCLGLIFVYFAVLISTRELGRADLARVRQVFARRAAA